jgi:hypothetical protein
VESPSMAEVGAPVILSLGVAGYCSVSPPLVWREGSKEDT